MRYSLISPLVAMVILVFASTVVGQGLDLYLPQVVHAQVTPTPVQSPITMQSDSYGRWLMRAWPEFVARSQRSITATASIAMIGDSWTSRDIISGPLRKTLQAQFGNAGIGYVGIGANHGPPLGWGVGYRRTGTWIDSSQKADSYGLDLASATTTDPAASVMITYALATDFVIHYLTRPGGGQFRVQVDAGPVRVVKSSAANSVYTTLRVGLFADGPHRLSLTMDVPGSAGVTLFGVDVQRNVGGVRVHRIGSGGATSRTYAQQDQRFSSGGLAALAPDVVLILLGTNDEAHNISLTEYADNMTRLVQRARAEAPAADILLVTPADNGVTHRMYTMVSYVGMLRQVAIVAQTAYLDTYVNLGPYARGVQRGLYSDGLHPSALGGQALANLIVNRMLTTDR